LGLTIEVKKEMNKETKKKNADVTNLQDFLKRLPKEIIVKKTSKGTILRHDKTYVMHVTQSPRGVHSFIRTKTGQHLESEYSNTENEINTLIHKINDKLKQGKTTNSSKVKNEKTKA
jgi:hypothetical protein